MANELKCEPFMFQGVQFCRTHRKLNSAGYPVSNKISECESAAAAPVPAGWQPIETAPRVGRIPILLWRDGMDFAQNAFADTWWQGGFSAGMKPTHWMPLPLPPKEKRLMANEPLKAPKTRDGIQHDAACHILHFSHGKCDCSAAAAPVPAEESPEKFITRLAERGQHEYVLELERLVDLLYRMARHVRNTEEMSAIAWGVKGMDLLAELRDLDAERYDLEVKANDTIPKIASRATSAPQGDTEKDEAFCRRCLTSHQGRQLTHTAYEMFLTRIAKYSDPNNEEWDWADVTDKWERHAFAAFRDLRDADAKLAALRSTPRIDERRQAFNEAIEIVRRELTYSDDVFAGDNRIPFDDLTMRDRAINALEVARDESGE